MSILIKGVDMPKHCADKCPLMENGRCWGVKNQPEPVVIAGHRPSWCPLIEWTVPHGRLIDLNAALSKLVKKLGIKSLDYLTPSERAIVDIFTNELTVIEAED